MAQPIIEVRGLSAGYDGRTVLHDVNLTVYERDFLGIIGPNGCGKSTLMKIVTGVIQPDEGEVEIGDTIKIGYFAQEVTDMDGKQRVIDYIKDVAEYVPTKEGLRRCWSDFCLMGQCNILRLKNCLVERSEDCIYARF